AVLRSRGARTGNADGALRRVDERSRGGCDPGRTDLGPSTARVGAAAHGGHQLGFACHGSTRGGGRRAWSAAPAGRGGGDFRRWVGYPVDGGGAGDYPAAADSAAAAGSRGRSD